MGVIIASAKVKELASEFLETSEHASFNLFQLLLHLFSKSFHLFSNVCLFLACLAKFIPANINLAFDSLGISPKALGILNLEALLRYEG
jgi:hypothetical protein